jgi:REP element-mobilizing transposase RayT
MQTNDENLKPTSSRRSNRANRSAPPYNPGLHKLIAGKQAWSEPLSEEAKAQGFLGWHQRGYLPHYDAPGVTQFVTLRLHDSMPASRRSEWEAFLHLEDDRERRKQLEAYLDRGIGDCWLRQPAIAELAENAIRFFDGDRYQLQAWVIMPNHIHLLVDVWQTPLAQLIKSWKQFIGREANKLLKREGTFLQRDYWDTLMMEDEAQRKKAVHYIETNPVKANLVRDPTDWHWSSARLRDNYGELKMPRK